MGGFVLSGGARLGVVQVGIPQALLGWGARPDFVAGTSVGAVNGAWTAGHPAATGADGLAAIWRSMRRSPEDAPVPAHVVATDVLTSEDVLVSVGPAVDAVMASAAVSRICSPVEIEGR